MHEAESADACVTTAAAEAVSRRSFHLRHHVKVKIPPRVWEGQFSRTEKGLRTEESSEKDKVSCCLRQLCRQNCFLSCVSENAIVGRIHKVLRQNRNSRVKGRPVVLVPFYFLAITSPTETISGGD